MVPPSPLSVTTTQHTSTSPFTLCFPSNPCVVFLPKSPTHFLSPLKPILLFLHSANPLIFPLNHSLSRLKILTLPSFLPSSQILSLCYLRHFHLSLTRNLPSILPSFVLTQYFLSLSLLPQSTQSTHSSSPFTFVYNLLPHFHCTTHAHTHT